MGEMLVRSDQLTVGMRTVERGPVKSVTEHRGSIALEFSDGYKHVYPPNRLWETVDPPYLTRLFHKAKARIRGQG